VLLNILPGLRELRAPLAAGYLWLLVGWLAFGDAELPRHAREFLEEFRGLGDAVALSFAAYLLGALLSDAFRPIWTRLIVNRRKLLARYFDELTRANQPSIQYDLRELRNREAKARTSVEKNPPSPRTVAARREAFVQHFAYAPHLSVIRENAVRTLISGVSEPLTVRGIRTLVSLVPSRRSDYLSSTQLGFVTPSEWLAGVSSTAASELDIARFRLLSEQRDLFNEVDRLRAEGQFRLAVAVPLIALAITLCVTEHFAWFIAALPVCVFAWQGLDRLDESGERVVDSLRAETVTIPALS
jgi:hypothetical protein